MCGVVGYLGSVNPLLIQRVVEESKIRGLHNLGHVEHKSGKAGLYHTRYCTSGKEHQPISIGDTHLVMNGVVHMGTKTELQSEFSMKLKTDNDAEVLLRLFMGLNSIKSIADVLGEASYAALIMTKTELFAFRNEKRPLWKIENNKSVLLASTLDILRRAGAGGKATQLRPNQFYRWAI